MADGLTIEVDTQECFAALDAAADAVARHTKEASRVTADRVAAEATSRVARRTGTTAEGIHVEETYEGTGYVVLATHPHTPGVPGFLEYGTVFMTKRPFLWASASLEIGPHERRISDATQAGLDEVGLGET